MTEQFSRTELLLGKQAIEDLSHARVAVFGVGGVGGYVCEALVRSGVGAFDLIDNDVVSESNINRQIIATHKTVGDYKVDVMKTRMLDINPDVKVNVYKCFYLPEDAREYNSETAIKFDFDQYDYVVDAIDTISAKLDIVERCTKQGIPVMSAMGAGNKLDPTRFKVSDIYQTRVCPLARVMRQELKKRGVKKLKVVYSEEDVIRSASGKAEVSGVSTGKRAVPGSTSFVPAVVGLIIASEVVKDIIANAEKKRAERI